MKEYVFNIVSENGKCRVELPDININGEYQAPDLMAALTTEFLNSDAVMPPEIRKDL